jgi:hypothetical protein
VETQRSGKRGAREKSAGIVQVIDAEKNLLLKRGSRLYEVDA